MVNLYLNDCEIDFQLDHEKNVADLVDSLLGWTNERDLILTELVIDNEAYYLEQIPARELKDIKEINCLVQSKSELIISSLYEGMNYCDRAARFINSVIDQATSDEIKNSDIREGIKWLIEMLGMCLQMLEIDPFVEKIDDSSLKVYLDKFKDLAENLSDDQRLEDTEILALIAENLLRFKELLRRLLLSDSLKMLIYKAIDSPDVIINALKEIEERLPKEIKNIEDAAIAYQTGKDEFAITKIQEFIDFIYLYLRTCYQLTPLFRINLDEIVVDDENLESRNSELQAFLNEIIEAMENNDIVSLADVMEYELKPLLMDLQKFIENILTVLILPSVEN